MGRKGSDPYIINSHVLEAYGYRPDDVVKWGGKLQNTASRRSADLMADGLMQAFFHAGTYPNPPMVEIARKRKLKAAFVSEPEIQAKLSKKLFIEVPIKAGSYTFVKENTTTVSMPAIIVVPADMKDDVAYNITRAVWEQREEFLYTVHVIFKTYLQPKVVTAWTTKLRDILHPGAARYWKEQGLLK
jgi:TRAP transporter TAXI family solute receptor